MQRNSLTYEAEDAGIRKCYAHRMATITPTRVRSQRKESSARAKKATLSDVHHALRGQGEFRRAFAGMRELDLLLATFLFTGLLTLMQSGVALAVREGATAAAMERQQPVSLTINAGSLSTQLQPFLQALLSLPYVSDVSYVTREQRYERERQLRPENAIYLQTTSGRNPFKDTVEVTLYSVRGQESFFTFLKRPQLQTLLHPSFLWEVPLRWQEQGRAARAHRSSQLLLLSGALAAFVLLLIAVAQFVSNRMRSADRQVHTLKLLGADMWFIRRPFFVEVSVLLLLGLVLSTVITWGGMGFVTLA